MAATQAQQLTIGARQQNHYVNTHAYHWHWEGEDTNLEEDSNTFIKIAHLLGFPDPKDYVLWCDTASPGFDLKANIRSLLNRAYLEPGNSVILLHYAGRAAVNHANELELISPFGTKIAVESIMIDLVSETMSFLLVPRLMSFLSWIAAIQTCRRMHTLVIAGLTF